MNLSEIKTIDIQTKVWFDKVFGNSYFAQRITLNYGLESEKELVNPFQYGYDSYDFKAFKFLRNEGVQLPEHVTGYELKESGVIVRSSTQRNCLKRDLKNI
jgi:hypothetical protein